jgi:hypothetical protein
MAPQPVQDTVISGLRSAGGPNHGNRKTSGELDEERKQELIMEKRLRACRVSILSKVSRATLVEFYSFLSYIFPECEQIRATESLTAASAEEAPSASHLG